MKELAVEVKNITKIFQRGKPFRIQKPIKDWQKTTTDGNYHETSSNLKNNSFSKTFTALDDISFDVPKGQVLGIIGLNGSGKTTLLRIIAGVYKPDAGTVNINGKLSPLMQLGSGFQVDLNAVENIIMNGMLLGISKTDIKKKVPEIIQYAELEKFGNMKIKHFSSGMRARLAFATAMQIKTDILLIDEILSVGDIEFQKKSYETILSMKKDNKTVIHTTHNLSRLEEFSDRVLLIDNGKKIMLDEPKQVIKKYQEVRTRT